MNDWYYFESVASYTMSRSSMTIADILNQWGNEYSEVWLVHVQPLYGKGVEFAVVVKCRGRK